MNQALIHHFQTLGFIHCKGFFSPHETRVLSDAFDAAMKAARNGAPPPELGQQRQQVNCLIDPFVPFFGLNPDVFYPLLTDQKFVDIFRHLLGDDFILPATEGILHATDTAWHHDNIAPDGFFTMRAHIYLDHLGSEDGCLNVIPGSHFSAYRQALGRDRDGQILNAIRSLNMRPENVPGRYPIANEPGDVIFMNHKLFHAALGSKDYRRCIHMNATKAAHTHSEPELVEALKTHLHHRCAEVRITAAAALRRIGTAEAMENLDQLERETSDTSKKASEQKVIKLLQSNQPQSD